MDHSGSSNTFPLQCVGKTNSGKTNSLQELPVYLDSDDDKDSPPRLGHGKLKHAWDVSSDEVTTLGSNSCSIEEFQCQASRQSSKDLQEIGAPAPRVQRHEDAPKKNSREAALQLLAKAATIRTEEIEAKRAGTARRTQRRTKTCMASMKHAPVIQADSELSTEGVASLATSGPSLPLVSKDTKGKVIFFDWDDTLLPTWYTSEVVRPCMAYASAPIQEHSMFYQSMYKHAQIVQWILRAASEVAHVAIVTLATRPWVTMSAERYLPGLNLGDLLEELSIPVYYAREFEAQGPWNSEEDGVDNFMISKRGAMLRHIRKVVTKSKVSLTHAVSIGDSTAEKDALKDIVWSEHELASCTTVQLAGDPSLNVLMDELQILGKVLPKMVQKVGDADIDVENENDVDGITTDFLGV